MKRYIAIIILIIILAGSWFFFTVKIDGVRNSQKAKMIDSIAGIERRYEQLFVLKKGYENAFDSVTAVNIILQTKREVNTSSWQETKTAAKQKCDTLIINQLDSIHLQSLAISDSMLQHKDLQIGFLRSELQLDTVALDMKDSIINIWSDAYLDLEEKSKKQKIKSFFKGFGVGYVAGFVSRSLLFRKE